MVQETGQVEDKRSVRPKKIYLQQIKSIWKSSPWEIGIWSFSSSNYCSLKSHRKWKGGCQEAVIKEGQQGEKAEVWQITHEVDWRFWANMSFCLGSLWLAIASFSPQFQTHCYCNKSILYLIRKTHSGPQQYKSLQHRFPIFQAKYKQTRGGSRLAQYRMYLLCCKVKTLQNYR